MGCYSNARDEEFLLTYKIIIGFKNDCLYMVLASQIQKKKKKLNATS